jgi:APA family basic amino acid/polyamine antiporter
MARVSPEGAPRASLLISTLIVLAVAPLGSFESLIFVVMWIVLAVDGLVIVGIFRLRRLHPDWPRPFRVPFYPILPALVLAVYAALLAGVTIGYPWLSALAVAVLAFLALVGWWRIRGSTERGAFEHRSP